MIVVDEIFDLWILECLCLMPNYVGAYNIAIAASTVLKIPLVIYGSVELAISLFSKDLQF